MRQPLPRGERPRSFNTQPPEGGWQNPEHVIRDNRVSTHSRLKAAGPLPEPLPLPEFVSTHSRLKAAGADVFAGVDDKMVSTHSRLKAAGSQLDTSLPLISVSTHSRLKAAGPLCGPQPIYTKSFNTQPPEGGWPSILFWSYPYGKFQHTAA